MKKLQQEKKKSNLEIFKEELKARQEEREERHRNKAQIKSGGGSSSSSSANQSSGGSSSGKNIQNPSSGSKADDSAKAFLRLDVEDKLAGSHDTGDPNTTNVYLGNLSPKLTEQELMEMFGKYGPLVSIYQKECND